MTWGATHGSTSTTHHAIVVTMCVMIDWYDRCDNKYVQRLLNPWWTQSHGVIRPWPPPAVIPLSSVSERWKGWLNCSHSNFGFFTNDFSTLPGWAKLPCLKESFSTLKCVPYPMEKSNWFSNTIVTLSNQITLIVSKNYLRTLLYKNVDFDQKK